MSVIVKYKFDKSIYENLIPVFNDGYTGYTVSDEIDSENSNHTIRTIECDILPTYMRFGIEVNNTLATSRELSLIEIISLDMSDITSMNKMFYHCDSLTSINTNNWDTSKVTNMYRAFSNCLNLTTLDLSNLNTENVETLWDMFWNCKKLISIGDISNWNTSKVKSLRGIFHFCSELVTINASNWDTSNVENMDGVFRSCIKLTSLDISNWDTSKVTDMQNMFLNCNKLTKLDLSSFNTSNVTTMQSMFHNCDNLVSIDLSNWDTSKVTDMEYMFNNDTILSNIGMIYCDFKTVEKVVSIISTTNPTTIWVGNHIDINGLPQYDYITYKVYEVEDKLEVELSSPLLEGDRLEIIDGNLYHYHEMGIIVLDGSKGREPLNGAGTYRYVAIDGMDSVTILNKQDVSKIFCDKILKINNPYHNNSAGIVIDEEYTLRIRLVGNQDTTLDMLSKKPTTVVYKLRNPYYELVKPNVGLLNAKQGLYLSISDSVVPINYQFDLCTTKLNYLLPNTQYKVSFKANEEGAISLNLGGALSPLDVTKSLNKVLITTPETLEHEYLKINGPSNIKISNIMVIDSEKDFDYFKGMNNNFDEKPVNNICSHRTLTYLHGTDEEGKSPKYELTKDVNKGKLLTVVGKIGNNPKSLPVSINLYNDTGRATGKNLFDIHSHIPSYEAVEIIDTKIRPRGTSWPVIHIPATDTTKMYKLSLNFDKSGCIIEGNTGLGIDIGTARTNYPNDTFWYNRQYTWTVQNLPDSLTVTLPGRTNGYWIRGNINIWYYNIQLEEGSAATEYELFRTYVNDNPVFIESNVALVDEGLVDISTTATDIDTNGEYFVVTIRADRDYANRIGFDIGDASTLAADDTVQITDLMVFEGDLTDCYPTTWQAFDETRYLAEFISYNNEFGFGKNRLI